MRVDEIIKSDSVTISFEVFPPKELVQIKDIGKIYDLCKHKPDYMSCTFGAGGGTRETSLEIEKVIQELGIPALAHLTCGTYKEEQIRVLVNEIFNSGIENLLILRGDEIGDSDYPHACDLIKYVKQSGADFCIGGACYPEGHPEAESQSFDIEMLKLKQDFGCDFFTTQMFFDNNVFYSFMYKIQSAGITVPVVPGIMPVVSLKQMKNSIKLSGNQVPRELINMADKFGSNDKAMTQAGIVYATHQIVDLIANGSKHIHIFTMNRPDVVDGIKRNLRHIINN